MKTHLIASQKSHELLTALLTASILIGLISCKSNEDASLTGDLKDLHSYFEGKMLYLENVETSNFEDSCVVKDGQFSFTVKAGEEFTPFRASIVHATGNPKWPYQRVGYKNPFKENTWESIFYMDRGEVHMEKDTTRILNGDDKVAFHFKNINEETAVAFKHFSLKSNLIDSEKNRNFNRSVILKHPNSVEMLDLLNRSKGYLNETEVKGLLSIFDESLKKKPLYSNLINYLNYNNQKDAAFPTDIVLKKPDNTTTSAPFNKKAKYNLVVFWASWCGPCRMEIPQLKKLHARHKDRVNIVSISVDKREDWWKKALEKEKMPWDQFLVGRDDSYVKLDKKYNIQSIPVWILLDENNKLIERKMGLDTEEEVMEQVVDIILVKDSSANSSERLK